MNNDYEVFTGSDMDGDACLYVKQGDDYIDKSRAEVLAGILQHVMNILRNVEGTVSIHAGVLTFPDGTRMSLNEPPPEQECEDCGSLIYSLVGCPDGAEICRDCLNAGGH
jgi:hypothetical protein